jgi:hypothetical protein
LPLFDVRRDEIAKWDGIEREKSFSMTFILVAARPLAAQEEAPPPPPVSKPAQV